ncbi:MAG: extracellular solute-binding protein [Tyzzerella sp.]|nr:extracellular solute-binding protein [Tyzzerella sp.]
MLKKKRFLKSSVTLVLAACVFSQGLVVSSANQDALPESVMDRTESDFYYTDYQTYNEYITGFTGDGNATGIITASAQDYDVSVSKEITVNEYDGVKAVTASEDSLLVIPVSVEESGFYNIVLDYYPVSDGAASIKFELLVDGELPFQEAQNMSLKRVWKDEEEKDYDSQGNQIRLPSSESPMWMNTTLSDTSGFSQEPFRFWLEKGAHTIAFSVYQNTLALSQIMLKAPRQLDSYENVLSEYEHLGYADAKDTYRVEAEAATAKSDRSIVIVNDKTSPVTVPYSGAELVYNSIGGGNWKTVGEWIEWEVEAPKDGLYTIVLRYKQDTKSGDVSFRKLYIDDEIPFEEAQSLIFNYDGNWQTEALGNGEEAYRFYLTEGKHTIRLEATLGSYSNMIAKVSDALTKLNDIYTDIVIVTGPNPDTDRDYQFEKIIPDVLEHMEVSLAELEGIEKELEQLSGEVGGENTAVVRRLCTDLENMLEEPESISKRLGNFMSDITSLGTWINTSREQPLQLDYMMLSNVTDGVPKDKSGFWALIKYHIQQFIYSFRMDYANVGNKDVEVEKEITVWIASGRDQADIIRQLVNETFTPEHGIGVNVQLVSGGALLPATLANVGPDVYLGMGQTTPVDYALRKAVVDLTQFEDLDTVLQSFYPESLTPFYLDESLYALPETMSYPMIFYRKDILTELGIHEEDLTTWESLLQKVLPELDMNNFDFGLSTGMNTYGNFLYQNGGMFYTEDHKAAALDTAEAIEAFETMATMYTDYGLPLSFDFSNRFRSGQMPLAVVDFTSYNQLSVFAPEIEGLWGMLPIPGTEDEEGQVDNSALCTVSGAVILSDSDAVEESWTFLKWWTSADTQARYGSELETVMGTGARYASANIEAMKAVEWERGIKDALTAQRESLIGMPSIAGGYYTSRNFDFAFRDVVYDGENMREVLADTNVTISKEISKKREEFYGKENK